MIESPYLLFLGDAPDMLAAKVAMGSVTGVLTMRWGRSACRDAGPIWA